MISFLEKGTDSFRFLNLLGKMFESARRQASMKLRI